MEYIMFLLLDNKTFGLWFDDKKSIKLEEVTEANSKIYDIEKIMRDFRCAYGYCYQSDFARYIIGDVMKDNLLTIKEQLELREFLSDIYDAKIKEDRD